MLPTPPSLLPCFSHLEQLSGQVAGEHAVSILQDSRGQGLAKSWQGVGGNGFLWRAALCTSIHPAHPPPERRLLRARGPDVSAPWWPPTPSSTAAHPAGTYRGSALHVLRVQVLQHVDFVGGGEDALCQVTLPQQRVHHRTLACRGRVGMLEAQVAGPAESKRPATPAALPTWYRVAFSKSHI